mmetsp:Transcript_70297/g.209529  ORF Transcript_70297/g.209529 Transcript_70297/m.209529 type:complete len:305 (+) Transcript_70297:132-1046(+)
MVPQDHLADALGVHAGPLLGPGDGHGLVHLVNERRQVLAQEPCSALGNLNGCCAEIWHVALGSGGMLALDGLEHAKAGTPHAVALHESGGGLLLLLLLRSGLLRHQLQQCAGARVVRGSRLEARQHGQGALLDCVLGLCQKDGGTLARHRGGKLLFGLANVGDRLRDGSSEAVHAPPAGTLKDAPDMGATLGHRVHGGWDGLRAPAGGLVVGAVREASHGVREALAAGLGAGRAALEVGEEAVEARLDALLDLRHLPLLRARGAEECGGEEQDGGLLHGGQPLSTGQARARGRGRFGREAARAA